MSVGRVVGILVLVVVLYAIISQPLDSAAMTRDGAGQLAQAGQSVTQFLSAVVGGTSGIDDAAQVSDLPAGGAATGDGSSAG